LGIKEGDKIRLECADRINAVQIELRREKFMRLLND